MFAAVGAPAVAGVGVVFVTVVTVVGALDFSAAVVADGLHCGLYCAFLASFARKIQCYPNVKQLNVC